MIQIMKLRPEHLLDIRVQDAQMVQQISPSYAREVVANEGVAYAAVLDGRTIACAGIAEAHRDRGIAWAMLADEALAHFRLIHRAVSRVVQNAPWRRVEMTVDVNHSAGIRWAERLGFEREGLMRSFTPDGRDCYLYARIR